MKWRMMNYNLAIAKGECFSNETVPGLLRDVADFLEKVGGILLAINVEYSNDDDAHTAYIMFE